MGDVKDEVRKVRQKWEDFDKLWKGKKKVWNEFESIENRKNGGERKREMKLLEEKVSRLEMRTEHKVKEKGDLEAARKGLIIIEVERSMGEEEKDYNS